MWTKMKAMGACVLSILLAFVASNPVMKYSACSYSDDDCEPTTFVSNSPLEFGNISSGIYFHDKIEQFSVSCTFQEPLHWIITLSNDHKIVAVSSNVTIINTSSTLFYYHMNFNDARYGLIRCESYQNSELAAEIYLARRGENYDFINLNSRLVEFSTIPVPKRGGKMIFPCILSRFDTNLNASAFNLKKIRHQDIITSEFDQQCFSCFPNTTNDDDNCSFTCPYGISKRIWNDVNWPLPLNNTGNQWLDCIRDPECAFDTIERALKLIFDGDCNLDRKITCSDYFSAISLYPSYCFIHDSILETNFRKIEGCIVKRFAQLMNSYEAEYDPRIGFQLTTERDLDAVYICSSATTAVYFVPHDTDNQINTRLKIIQKIVTTNLTGIACTVPEETQHVTLELIQCSTLFDCELQLHTTQVEVDFRVSNTIIIGEMISDISSQFNGKIIQNPPRSGIVQCSYVDKEELQYYFIGLNSKIYFLSSAIPAEALILIKLVKKDVLPSNELEVECVIHNFIVFPSFDFIVEYSNETIWHTLIPQAYTTGGYQRKIHYETQNLVVPFIENDSVVSVKCSARLRNSKNSVEASVTIQAGRKPSIEKLPISIDDGNTMQTYLGAISAVAGVVLMLCSIICVIYSVRRYKKSKELRQLTMGEINEFLNGHAALVTGPSNEAIVDAIDFPECYHIQQMDLKMHLQKVLGEGEFGRCVTGEFHNQKVAIKTTKSSVDVTTFKEFLREVKIMAYLGNHENIVQFLGAVVNQLRDRKCFAVMEISPHGDLLSYLRRTDAQNPSYVNLYESLTHGNLLETSQMSKLERNHLIYFCEQIAAGMEFVGQKKVVHGDLAARNVVVFPDYVVKITDFGLSRKMYTASNYKKKNATPLPWRWMAIESLKYMEFSSMSDIWAYGITVWEIFTLGQVPYAGLGYSFEYVGELEGGRRLQCPKNLSEEIYQFIKLCWDYAPSARPSFKDARIFFRRLSAVSQ